MAGRVLLLQSLGDSDDYFCVTMEMRLNEHHCVCHQSCMEIFLVRVQVSKYAITVHDEQSHG